MPCRVVHVAPAHQPRSTPIGDPTETTPDARWRALFGTEPPRSASLVAQAIAWREQIATAGDVREAIRRDLVLAADEARNGRAHGASADQLSCGQWLTNATGATPSPVLPPASSRLVPGTRLVKAHGGRTHVVEVTEAGMLYEGQVFASLSAVAKAITGTHWNGLLFFGLRRRKAYPAKVAAHG